MDTYFAVDRFCTRKEACVSPEDAVVQKGYGAFERLRSYHGIPFHLDDHLARFAESARLMGLPMPYSLEEISAIVVDLMEKNGFDESDIKIYLTPGSIEDMTLSGKPARLYALIAPFVARPSKSYTDGISVSSTTYHRTLPIAKSTQYMPGILALREGARYGAEEALYVDSFGAILEGTTSNFFAVKNKTIYTASEGILYGVTRKVVLDLVKEAFNVVFDPVPIRYIDTFDECFITSTTREVMGVVSVDGLTIGDGTVGPITREIMARFSDYAGAYCLAENNV